MSNDDTDFDVVMKVYRKTGLPKYALAQNIKRCLKGSQLNTDIQHIRGVFMVMTVWPNASDKSQRRRRLFLKQFLRDSVASI